MKYLVHCILRNPAARPAARREGVTFVESGNLAAAVTLRDSESAPLQARQLLRYQRAISHLHAAGPVIPLRYGCLVADEAAAVRLLEERRAEYEALLERLEDRVEIGLRVYWDAPEDCAPAPMPATPGAAYLAVARRRHGAATGLTPAEREWAGGVCAGLSGLYSEERREARCAGPGRLVSLYFLVPRPAVRRFRARLRRMLSGQGCGFLVSGPWPPYNFVMGAISHGDSHAG
jgi:Gas vesicle synthesis protein GvpL/GvpF